MHGLLDCEDQLLLAAVPINHDTVGIVIPSLGKCSRCVMCRPDPNWNRLTIATWFDKLYRIC